MPEGRVARPEAIRAALLFAALTVLMTWPQAAHLGDRLNDLWDAKQNAWILDWDFRQTLHDPANLFQAPILHPARYALAFSENLYGGAVFGFPLRALGAPILVNYNLVFLFSMAFSAWAAWLLAAYVTGDAAASLVAGLVYAFVPWRFAQLPHINMQLGAFLCLLFYFLLRYLDEGRRRDLAGFGVCFAWNLLSTFHYGLFSGFLVAVVLAVEGLAGPAQRRRIPAVVAAAGVATVACAPFLIPYLKAARLYGMRRSLEEMREFSARPSDYLSAGARNRLYGAATGRWSRAEGDLFPGLAPLVLAGVGIARVLRTAARRRLVLLVLVAIVGVLVAAGANTPFYRFLFVHLGVVFRAIRVPARAIAVVHAALGVLAAWGLSSATRGLSPRTRFAAVALALTVVGFEYRAFPLELHPYDAAPRAVDAWLRANAGGGAVIEWPLGFPHDCEAMLRQADHGRPLINGHQSYFPPAYRRLVDDMAARPIGVGVWDEVAALDAAVLLFHPDGLAPYDRVRYRRLLREGLEQDRLRLLKSFPSAGATTFAFRLTSRGAGGGRRRRLRRPLLAARPRRDAVCLRRRSRAADRRHSPSRGGADGGARLLGSRLGRGRLRHRADRGGRGLEMPPGPAMVGTPWPGLEKLLSGTARRGPRRLGLRGSAAPAGPAHPARHSRGPGRRPHGARAAGRRRRRRRRRRSRERDGASPARGGPGARVLRRRDRGPDVAAGGAARERLGGSPRQQAPGVRMQRVLEELVDRSLLGHPRGIHDDDLVGDLGDDAEVVGDHDDRRAVVVLELVHQLEDLGLRRHVECGRRLVGDQ